MNGIINLLKPPCLSSAQAVSFIKRLTGQKTGHAGTLDPEACGVLPIMIGKATSLFDYIAEHQKVYVAQIAFGTATDTQDATGIVMHKGHNYPDIDALRSVLDSARKAVKASRPWHPLLRDSDSTNASSRVLTPSRREDGVLQISLIPHREILENRPHGVSILLELLPFIDSVWHLGLL